MSLDRSLKSRAGLTRHRNVLTRAQRIVLLEDEGRWKEGDSVFALPKVKHRKSHAGAKVKAKKAEAAAAAAETTAETATEEKKPKE